MYNRIEIHISREDIHPKVEIIKDGKVADWNKLFKDEKFVILGLLAEAHNKFADYVIKDDKAI